MTRTVRERLREWLAFARRWLAVLLRGGRSAAGRRRFARLAAGALAAMLTVACAQSEEKAASAPDALPEFPWYPPTPTDSAELPRAYFESAQTLWDVNARLSEALNQAGYAQRTSYYRVPNGFALVARIEFLRDDAAPQEERFGLIENPPAGLLGAVVGVLFPRVGYYRQVVFLVTDQPWRPERGPQPDTMTAGEAERLLEGGGETLPDTFQTAPFGENFKVTALIYEYVARGPRERTRSSPVAAKRNTARTHLARAGILRRLED